MKAPSQAGPVIAQPAIRLAGVNLSLGQGAARVHILKDIDLNIGSGEAIGLVGPSGSGKSTLLMVMAGLERTDTGAVAVAGEDLNALDEDALARFRGRRVGIVFQSFHLIPTMTALENVAVPLELAGVADAQERARNELLGVGLGERLHHYPAELSGGEQQRVAVARALAPDPAILVAEISTRIPASRSSICSLQARSSAAPRWCWSRTMPRSPRAAGGSCGCAPAASTA
jgi:putative ABC transport system ATP-binding protein